MNIDNQRLKEIQTFKAFYHARLEESETELETDLLNIQLDKLDDEEQEILKRCDVII